MGGIFTKIWDKVTDIGHAVTGIPTAEERRAAMTGLKDQANFQREQMQLARNETERLRGEADAEKRRINEKQIRSMRRSFRPAGFLDQPGNVGANSQLTTRLGE